MFLIPHHLRIFQHIEQYQHGNCRILANGMRIWHLKCHHCIPPILGRRPQSSYPRCSFWTCLQPFLLDFNQPHPTLVIWRSSIWIFHSCIKCSLYTAAVPSRWWLWKWVKQRLTNTIGKDSSHIPCIQSRTCIIPSCLFHTTSTCWSTSLQYTFTPTQVSASLPILQ